MRFSPARSSVFAPLVLALLGLPAVAQENTPAPAAKSGQTSEPAKAVAQETAKPEPKPKPKPAAPKARGPKKLDTGYDLSKLRVPQQSPAASPLNPAAGAPGALGGAAAPAAAPTGPPAVLEYGADEGQHDFGELVQGDVRTTVFRIKSAGDVDLVIKQIKPSCGCTVAQTMVLGAGEPTPYVMNSPLPPGTELEVTAQLNTRNKHGHVQSNINIFCNDERGVVPLTLRADVRPFLVLDPLTLNLGDMLASGTAEGKVTVTSEVTDSFLLTAEPAGVLGDELKIECTPVNPGPDGRAASWTLQVVLGPNVPEGRRNYPIRLRTDHAIEGAPAGPDGLPAVHEAMASVYANVTGLVSAEPRYMSFGLMRPDETKVSTVRLTCIDPDHILAKPTPEVLGFQGDFEYPDNVTINVTEVEPGKSYDIEVEFRAMPEARAASVRGQLVIATGHPANPEIRVPFSGLVRGNVQTTTPARPKPPMPQPPASGADDHAGHDHGGAEQN